MNPNEDNYEQLQKLLTLKRHEQPPPGYFHGFSDKVIARLEAENAAPYSWWQRWISNFDAKPVVACAYGVAVGVLLLFGVGFAQIFENEQADTLALKSANHSPWLASTPIPSVVAPGNFVNPQFVSSASAPSSINPVVNSGPPSFLFDGSGLKAETASFKFR